jgi:hypothetical protein
MAHRRAGPVGLLARLVEHRLGFHRIAVVDQLLRRRHVILRRCERLVDLVCQGRGHLAELGQTRHVDQLGFQLAQALRALGALAAERARLPGIHRGRFEQQHDQDECRCDQAVDAAGVEAEIEARGVQHGTERDLEHPHAHHRHQPDVEQRAPRHLPQRDQRQDREQPGRGDDRHISRRVAPLQEQRRQGPGVAADERRQRGHGSDGRGDPDDRPRPRPPFRGFGAHVSPLEKRVSDHEQREAAVPEHVEIDGALRTGAEQTARREQAGKRQRVRHHRQRREHIAAGEHEDRPRPQDGELTEQQGRRDQIVDRQRRFVGRDEAGQRRQRLRGERNGREEHEPGQQHDDQRQTALSRRGRQARQDQERFAPCVHRQRPPQRVNVTLAPL